MSIRRRRVAWRESAMILDARRPILCLVSDRTQLGTGVVGWRERLLDLVRNASVAGVDLVQIRENDLADATLADLVGRSVQVTRNTRTRIIVNDRVDVALAAGADGVHLKGSAYPAERIRQVAPPEWTIGRSVHGIADAVQATEAGATDYVTFGTVFETASKPGVRPAGLEALGRVVERLSVPVLAIGGVTADRALEIARSGAAGLAAIGLFAAAGQSVEALRALVVRLEAAFGEAAGRTHE